MSDEAWEAIALGEAAAVYGYGVLAGRLDQPQRTEAANLAVAHARDRDRARAALSAHGSQLDLPTVFELPEPLRTPADARRVAALLESRLVTVYANAAPALTGADRLFAAQAAQSAQVRAIGWGAESQPIP